MRPSLSTSAITGITPCEYAWYPCAASITHPSRS
jgi:hypothetical protein